MKVDNFMNVKDDTQYFVFEHDKSYQQIQMTFIKAVQSLNPENIIVSSDGKL